MATLADYTLDPDLSTGVIPISKAASSLAALLKRAATTRRPIVVTQKGYPQGVILSVELFDLLRQLTEAHRGDADVAGEERT